MKTACIKAISGATLAIVMVLASAYVPAVGQGKARRIEGTWRVQITPRNCDTGVPAPITFPGKNTFLSGGSMIGTGSTTTPYLLSTGHGVWEHTGGRTFINTLEFFAYTQDHVLVGTQKVTRNIELSESGDEFTSTTMFEIIAPNGNVIGRGCATDVGTRLE